MTKEFGRMISNLRKKRGLSQKDAAAELGISQSLLSHYEKGIRECGLEFLVKIAEYYEVSTDYLLGRAPAANAEENAASTESADVQIVKSNTFCLLNRRVINNSASIIYSILSDINNKKLQKNISDYLSIAHYNMFRKLYSLKENNPNDIFKLRSQNYETLCDAGLRILEARIKTAAENIDGPKLSFDILADKFPESISSLNEMIKNAETAINQNIKLQ
ncbi:MAG: helix-turn-helix transcriptional regulator [Ruminococcus sp.]|nr:helix-turn-helix transcriptional regulator [Ruminococcus sp.]